MKAIKILKICSQLYSVQSGCFAGGTTGSNVRCKTMPLGMYYAGIEDYANSYLNRLFCHF